MLPQERLFKTDFAALRTLQFVHDLGSFSRAADRLGITQSNVSYTVARLRDAFRDPLFVREGNRMIPTARCSAVVQYSAGVIEDFQSMTGQVTFDPATARDVVTLSCNHYERMTMLPQLIRTLRAEAPGLTLRVLTSKALGSEQLKRGECDLVIGPMQISGEQVFTRRIRADNYVCIMDPGNPLTRGALTVDRLVSANHIVIRFSGGWKPVYLHTLEAMGILIDPAVELSEYGDIGGYVRGSDLVAVVPGCLARQLAPDLVRRDLPFAVPLVIDLYWTTRTNRSPLFIWLRDKIARLDRDPGRLGGTDR